MLNAKTPKSIAIDDSSTSTSHLVCYFKKTNKTSDNIENERITGKAVLFRELGKKSSYLFQQKQEGSSGNPNCKDKIDGYSIPTPANMVIEHDVRPATDATSESINYSSFFFGGLQLVFSAKTIEIYLTVPGGEETYLMTCKGIPYNKDEKKNVSNESTSSIQSNAPLWRRALCVVPGGPRCVSSLRIKLIGSTSASDKTTINVQHIKLTARTVNPSQSSFRRPMAPKSSHTTSTNPQTAGRTIPPSLNRSAFAPMTSSPHDSASMSSEPPLTQSDLGAAMAGLSFMARKTEENITALFKQQSKKMEDHLESYFAGIDQQMRTLKPVIVAQHQLIAENQTMIKKQQQIMDHQNTQINKLLNGNQDLKVRVQSLQADISILQSQASYTNRIDETNTSMNLGDIGNPETTVTEKSVPSSTLPLDVDADDDDDDDDFVRVVPGSDERIEKLENINLRKVIQNTARDFDEDPLLKGCGAPMMMYNGTDNRVKINKEPIDFQHLDHGTNTTTKNLYLKKVVGNAAKDLGAIPFAGGCGAMLHDMEGGIMRKIDAAISSRIRPSTIPLDTTESIKQIQQKYHHEFYNHSANIEVTLKEDEGIQLDEEDDKEKIFFDEKSHRKLSLNELELSKSEDE
mmetsp:Transcript_20623/g.42402  ORF Transcript_20623/g.42402 Transcript_20623/m.42402 type:complete len:630 (+) Transcript_20623:43-1932(+)